LYWSGGFAGTGSLLGAGPIETMWDFFGETVLRSAAIRRKSE